jgi:hypothetical protein
MRMSSPLPSPSFPDGCQEWWCSLLIWNSGIKFLPPRRSTIRSNFLHLVANPFTLIDTNDGNGDIRIGNPTMSLAESPTIRKVNRLVVVVIYHVDHYTLGAAVGYEFASFWMSFYPSSSCPSVGLSISIPPPPSYPVYSPPQHSTCVH